MKKSKVTKVTKMDKKDSYGNTSFIVEFDNGDKGFYTSKNENQNKFVSGSEAEYNIERKVGKNDKEYFKITPPQSDKPFGSKPAVDPRVQMISFAMSYTKDLIVADRVKMDDLLTTFNKIYNEMISKL